MRSQTADYKFLAMSTNDNFIQADGAAGGSYFIPIRPAQDPSQASPSNPAASPSNPAAGPSNPAASPSNPPANPPQASLPTVPCYYCQVTGPISWSCPKHQGYGVYICELCRGFGMHEVHESLCFGGAIRYKDGVSVNFECRCTPSAPLCNECLKKKVSKYTCFVCTQKPSTIACKCLNYFFCSKECLDAEYMPGRTHTHALVCGMSLPVWCGHAHPLLCCSRGCTTCQHGLWDQDCFLCMRV